MKLNVRKSIAAVPLAFAMSVGTIGVVAAPPGQAASVHATTGMGQVTKTGHFEKLLSSTSFKLSVGMESYIVKADAMTHVTLDSMKVQLSKLHKDDTVKVKGVLKMGVITAASIAAEAPGM